MSIGPLLRRSLAGSALALSSACLAPHANAADITVVTPPGGRPYISVEGEIVVGDDKTFRRLVLEREPATVVLDSEGGFLVPAIEIGKVIRTQALATVVPDDGICTSSCALIWLAGLSRSMSQTSRVGFHASYMAEGGRLVETGVGNAIIGHYLSLLNYSGRTVIFATSASPTDIRWLDERTKSASGIDFALALAKKSPTTGDAPVRANGRAFPWDGPHNWRVFELDTGCALTLSFGTENGIANKSVLSLNLSRRKDSSAMIITNEKFRSIVIDREYNIRIKFFRSGSVDNGWGVVTALGLQIDGQGKGLCFKLRSEVLDDIAKSAHVAFFAGTKFLDVFDLTGSELAVRKLRECSHHY